MHMAQFDLRLYALVPSFSPLVVYMYRSGFARFTNARYNNNPGDIANSFIHLTNVAIQKTCENYNKKVHVTQQLQLLTCSVVNHSNSMAVSGICTTSSSS